MIENLKYLIVKSEDLSMILLKMYKHTKLQYIFEKYQILYLTTGKIASIPSDVSPATNIATYFFFSEKGLFCS